MKTSPRFLAHAGAFALLVLATSGCAPSSRAPEVAPLTLTPCEAEGPGSEFLCGTYEVYENRDARSGRKIGLHVVVVPATGEKKAPDAITYFAGGPGDASTTAAPGLAQELASLRESRDLLLVDFRGTGESNPLRCSYQDQRLGYLEGFLPLDGVRACWEEVRQKADPSFYTTSHAVDDVDDVRAALGYETLNVIGGSYGTRAALVYLRRHPERVRTVLLDGPDPTDSRSPVTFARDAQAALDGWFAECREDTACAAAFPEIESEFQSVIAKLTAGAVDVEVMNPRSGAVETVSLSKDAFAQTVRYMLYNTTTALKVPLYVHAAATGNFAPMGEMTVLFGGLVDSLADGFFLSVTCAEDLPFFEMDEADELAAGTFLGIYRSRSQKEACALWPVAAVDPSFLEPVRSEVPVLVRVGQRDPVTPPRWGEEVIAHLPNSRLLVIPDGAHGTGSLAHMECADEMGVTLIESGSVAGLDTATCAAQIERAAFDLSLPEETFIELGAEVLAHYPGTYTSAEPPITIDITLEGERLIAHPPGRDPIALVPLSETRFKILGAPPGYYFVFHLGAEGAPEGVTLEQGGMGEPIEMVRQ